MAQHDIDLHPYNHYCISKISRTFCANKNGVSYMSWGWDHILAKPALFSPCVSHIFLLPLVLLSLIPTYLGAKDHFIFASKITSEIHPYGRIYKFIDLEVCMWIHTFNKIEWKYMNSYIQKYEFIGLLFGINEFIHHDDLWHTFTCMTSYIFI